MHFLARWKLPDPSNIKKQYFMIRMAFFGLSYREFSRAENIIKTDELYSEVFDIYLVQVNPKNRMGGGGGGRGGDKKEGRMKT